MNKLDDIIINEWNDFWKDNRSNLSIKEQIYICEQFIKGFQNYKELLMLFTED